MVNQAKLRSFNTSPKYKNGFEVPQNYDQAMKLDAKNGNTKGQEEISIELVQINEYKTFIEKAIIPKLNLHLVIRRYGYT
jgi:hypothetical protein